MQNLESQWIHRESHTIDGASKLLPMRFLYVHDGIMQDVQDGVNAR